MPEDELNQMTEAERAAYFLGWYGGIASLTSSDISERDALAAAVGHLSTELERARGLLAGLGVTL